jgi:hypothetical protein
MMKRQGWMDRKQAKYALFARRLPQLPAWAALFFWVATGDCTSGESSIAK